MVPGIAHNQETRRVALKRLARVFAQGAARAVETDTAHAVLGVTAAMNLFVFSYTALVPPLARVGFGVSEAMVGILPAGEPRGTLAGGLALARWKPPFDPRRMLLAGSGMFMSA